MSDKQTAIIGRDGIVNISIDTKNRTVALIADGVIIPATDLYLDKFTIDGEQFINFSYTMESVNPDGMQERRQFFLPRPEDTSLASKGELDEFGFASKVLHDDEKAKADVIDFLSKDKNPG